MSARHGLRPLGGPAGAAGRGPGAARRPRRDDQDPARSPRPRSAGTATSGTAMVEQGWLGIAVPESEGGVGSGPSSSRCCSRRSAATSRPLRSSRRSSRSRCSAASVTSARSSARSPGDLRACIAWSRDPGRSGRSPRAGSGCSAVGPDPVPFAPVADLALVVASDADGPGAVRRRPRRAGPSGGRARHGPHPPPRMARARRHTGLATRRHRPRGLAARPGRDGDRARDARRVRRPRSTSRSSTPRSACSSAGRSGRSRR